MNNQPHFLKTHRKQLQKWYLENHRPLPWRESRDPYKVWISEIMLQQTTTTAVVPYFERFLKKFPHLKALASASEEDVVSAWAGLGYYSRARNVLKSAQLFDKNGGLPSTYEELLSYPGIGPYTSRSIASIAFGQDVGVLDGNVIRVLTRFFNLAVPWWKSDSRKLLQTLADNVVQGFPPEQINQAMMELGATICTPTSPKCLHCPWIKSCQSYKHSFQDKLPLVKPKRQSEIWLWSPIIVTKNSNIALCKNNYAPFLKGQWFLPGKVKRLQKPPKSFDFRHAITHHKIFVTVVSQKTLSPTKWDSDIEWVRSDKVSLWSPSSMVQKAIQQIKTKGIY
ncbi:MAG: A/G-specific adenine glycosylase [Bdellovibrionales bacterium]|nr:A/G-specific adenine glycosylase [Bdellovibrionales bacterium]